MLIDDEKFGTALQGEARQICRGENGERCAKDEVDIAAHGEAFRGKPRLFRKAFTEERDGRFEDATACAARHFLRLAKVHDFVEGFRGPTRAAIMCERRAVNFVDVMRADLLMEHVDVLCRDAVQAAAIFEMLERLVDGARRELAKAIDELRATFVVNGRIAIEPIDIEDAFGVGLLVEALRTAEIRNATQG